MVVVDLQREERAEKYMLGTSAGYIYWFNVDDQEVGETKHFGLGGGWTERELRESG